MENIRRLIKQSAAALKNGINSPDFWNFIRIMESGNENMPRLGCAKRPMDENIRFGQIPYLHFTATEIAEIIEGGVNPSATNIDALIFVHFFGLMGVYGPMPLEFTSYVFRRSRSHYDNVWRRFLDIINHRFLTLFCRAHSVSEQCLSFDRQNDDSIGDVIKALAGVPPCRDKTNGFNELDERVALNAAQHFSFAVRNRCGLLDTLRS
ncbi:MAG: type VI secretion system baseplate subunit TssG, partial [Spirochaetaceae bacterium]|nr:type VI secretion system baseplate subunit TssG [Spirochaetaceae bacterium]